MHVAVGSTNPVKLEAAHALETYGPCAFSTAAAVSGVRDQPMSEEETRTGAMNRARDALAKSSDATHGLGLEGGVRDDGESMWTFACCAIVDRAGREGSAFTGEFQLPHVIRERILAGEELGPVLDDMLHRADVKKQEGAVGVLTKGAIDRANLYRHAVLLAFIPFLHEELY